MFVLNLAVVIGVIFLLQREAPRPLVITVPPTRAPAIAATRLNANQLATDRLAPATPIDTSIFPARINLNTATLEELQDLPAIGPVLAQRIIDYRSAHGRFRSVLELKEIQGIGDIIFDRVKELISVE
jgi:competence ComEA-like helix-hairpin-helix protein